MGTGVEVSKCTFSETELRTINVILEKNKTDGPKTAYCWFKGIENKSSVKPGEIEDFFYSFYYQYEKMLNKEKTNE